MGNFQFDKEELRKKFEGWCESAKAIANADSERNNLRGEFRECFEKIKSDIEHAKWKSSLDQELMDTLTHIQDYLMNNHDILVKILLFISASCKGFFI